MPRQGAASISNIERLAVPIVQFSRGSHHDPAHLFGNDGARQRGGCRPGRPSDPKLPARPPTALWRHEMKRRQSSLRVPMSSGAHARAIEAASGIRTVLWLSERSNPPAAAGGGSATTVEYRIFTLDAVRRDITPLVDCDAIVLDHSAVGEVLGWALSTPSRAPKTIFVILESVTRPLSRRGVASYSVIVAGVTRDAVAANSDVFWRSPRRHLVERFAMEHNLSNREAEVVDLASMGNSTKEIAAQLGTSQQTVAVYWARIYRKLCCCSRGEVMARLLAAAVGEQ
jgi:DNA-binding CsgD family transcriptional regulator